MDTKTVLFNFNSLSHLSMSLSKFFLFLQLGSGPQLILYALGHFFISIAQYFIKYTDDIYKYLSSSFGIAGHTCLLSYIALLIKGGNKEILSYIFFMCQFGMMDFYLNNMLTVGPVSDIKRIIFSIVFTLLVMYYVIEGFKTKNFTKYSTVLVGMVYLDLLIYINTMGSA